MWMGSLYGLKALSCSPPGTNKLWCLSALYAVEIGKQYRVQRVRTESLLSF